MERRAVSGIMLTLEFYSLLALAFNLQAGEVSGTIFAGETTSLRDQYAQYILACLIFNGTESPIITKLTDQYASAIHDIAATNITAYKTVVGQNHSSFINVTVENQGTNKENVNTTVYVQRPPSPQEKEIFWSMGDVNRDGYIDLIDIDLIYDSWNATPTDPNWNPDADLNKDLIINENDLDICLSNQGLDIWFIFPLATTIGPLEVANLPNGTSTTITFTWNTTGCVKANYTITAYAWPVPDETDTTDNFIYYGNVTVALIGDITGSILFIPDGKVDIRDIALVAKNFGQNVPPAPPNCDITGPTTGVPDRKIDIRDVAIAAIRFGQVDS